MTRLFIAFMLIATMACSQKKTKSNSDRFGERQQLAQLDNKKLKELSGLAASAVNQGMLWTHNDSGNGNQIFLVDQKLEVRMTCRLQGVINRDWEDIAVGPGPVEGKNYVYVGEIGDNMAMFQYKHIYRFEEPSLKDKQGELIITEFDRITFQLPEKKKDSEALLVHPITKKIYVTSKNENPVQVYELDNPDKPTDTLTARSFASIPFKSIVAGDFSPDGKEIIFKNYDNVFYWIIGSSQLKAVLQEKPFILEYIEEAQGESITFARDGSGYFTISEVVGGEKSFLYFYPRKK